MLDLTSSTRSAEVQAMLDLTSDDEPRATRARGSADVQAMLDLTSDYEPRAVGGMGSAITTPTPTVMVRPQLRDWADSLGNSSGEGVVLNSCFASMLTMRDPQASTGTMCPRGHWTTCLWRLFARRIWGNWTSTVMTATFVQWLSLILMQI